MSGTFKEYLAIRLRAEALGFCYSGVRCDNGLENWWHKDYPQRYPTISAMMLAYALGKELKLQDALEEGKRFVARVEQHQAAVKQLEKSDDHEDN